MTRIRTTSTLAVFSMGALLASCGVQHIRPEPRRHRDYEVASYGEPQRPTGSGSLWQDESRGYFADFRASRLGDIVTVRVDETVGAGGAASTDLDHSGSSTFGAPQVLGLTQVLARAYPDLDPSRLFDVMSNAQTRGSGDTSRTSHAQASIAVRVARVLPNGDFFVEGTKVLMINSEELHVYVSGVIRPEDIGPDNTVRSSAIADAEIEFTGSGDVTRSATPGFLSRVPARARPL